MEKNNNPTLEMAAAELSVSNLALQTKFYKDLVGLEEIQSTENSLSLGIDNEVVLILREEVNFEKPKTNEAGLYHIAFVYSERKNLANALVRILESKPDLYSGSADHIVTEAFYFSDFEGNGVELYFDKPKANWVYDGNGKPLMGSEYIDIVRYIEEYTHPEDGDRIIKIGHMHLKVGDIKAAKEFYVETLGFDLIFEMPTALFVSKDNYHHHIGMNTWESLGAGAVAKNTYGLRHFSIKVFDKAWFESLQNNLVKKNLKFKFENNTLTLSDPWGNTIIFNLI